MTSTEWAAWAAVLAALVSIVASVAGVYWQIKKQWLLHSATMVTALLGEFESEEFKRKRRQCSELAALHLSGENASLIGNYGFGVLGFFEHVGHLVRRGALDTEMIWNRLGWEIVGYYEALTAQPSLIAQLREDHPSAYSEFEWLHRTMLVHFRRHGDRVYSRKHELVWMSSFLNQERLGGAGIDVRTENRLEPQRAPNPAAQPDNRTATPPACGQAE